MFSGTAIVSMAAGVLFTFVPLTIAACGAAESEKTPAQILQDASTATKAVSTYHVSGSGQSGSSTSTFDLHIGGPGAASGSLKLSGVTAQLIVVNGEAYIKGHDFLQQVAGSQAASIIDDNWVMVPASDASDLTRSFAGLTDTKKLGGCLVNGLNGINLIKSTATVNGRSVVVLNGPAITMAFASSGPTYLVQVKSTGSTPSLDNCKNGSSSSSSGSSPTGEGGTINFDSWGAGVTVMPPPHPVDLSGASGG
jgi:hypothetical protein